MKGQGAIIGVGAMEYPAGVAGRLARRRSPATRISKVMTLTSTYDHRVIQGAQSGEFLRRVHQLLLGEDDFYDEIFRSLRIPYEPIRWAQDIVDLPRRRHQQAGPDPRADPRLPGARPHDGRHRPAGVPPAQPPRPRGRVARPDPVGPRPRVRHRLVRRRGPPLHEAARTSSASCATPTAAPPASSTCTSWIPSSAAGSRSGSSSRTPSRPARSSCGSC